MANIIIKNCNQCELDVPLKYGQKLFQDFAVRHPNAFYLRTRVRGMSDWDGKVKFITKTGLFKIGLLPAILAKCKEYGLKVNVIDMRRPVPRVTKVVKKIGRFTLRPEQVAAVESICFNQVNNQPFHIGVLDYTVNAGKTLIMAATYLSFKRELKTLLITNDSDWFRQAQEEFKEYLPGENINFIQGRSKKPWAQFNIGMVQSISRNMKFYQREMAGIDMVFVDEADQAGSRQYQNVLTHLFNTRVRIGLSGTIYMSKLAKDKVKNMNLRAFFGDVIGKFTLRESIDKGYSTNVVVKMIEVGKYFKLKSPDCTLGKSYQELYENCIIKNPAAVVPILHRAIFNIRRGRIPLLVVCKFVKHAELLCKILKTALGKTYNIACVHVKTPDKERKKIMQDFRSGKIQILVSTTIIARGKNFPLLRAMINAGSMKAQEKTIQFLGRLVRTHSSKSKTYLDDIHYPGKYLDNHGRSRRRYYQEQKLKVLRITFKTDGVHPFNLGD